MSLPEMSFDQFAEASGLPAVFGPEELMQFLGIDSKRVIYTLNQRGLPRFAVGKHVRYRRDKALAWLEGQMIECPSRSQ